MCSSQADTYEAFATTLDRLVLKNEFILVTCNEAHTLFTTGVKLLDTGKEAGFNNLKEAARLGHTKAMFWLGQKLMGQGIPETQSALNYLIDAIRNNDGESMYYVIELAGYKDGQFINDQVTFNDSLENGKVTQPLLMFAIDQLLKNNHIQHKKHDTSKKAAEKLLPLDKESLKQESAKGNANADYELGKIYWNDPSLYSRDHNIKESNKYFGLAIQRGNTDAIDFLHNRSERASVEVGRTAATGMYLST